MAIQTGCSFVLLAVFLSAYYRWASANYDMAKPFRIRPAPEPERKRESYDLDEAVGGIVILLCACVGLVFWGVIGLAAFKVALGILF